MHVVLFSEVMCEVYSLILNTVSISLSNTAVLQSSRKGYLWVKSWNSEENIT